MRVLNRIGRTFAGVAAAVAGLAPGGPASADEYSPTIAIYAPNNNLTPKFRRWTAGAWSDTIENLPSITAYSHWIVARNCPTRNETACMILDESRDLHVMFYMGDAGGGNEAWSIPELLCTDVGISYIERACDMVYENSGDMLVAYWDATEQVVNYRHASGGVVSGEGSLDMLGAPDIRWLCLVQYPRSNKIILLAVDTVEKLYGAVWGGSGFFPAELLCADVATDQRQGFHAGFEGLSGEGIIGYCAEADGVLLYRTLVGNVIGPEQTGPTLGAVDHYWVRLSGCPTSDQVVAVSLNASKELHASTWDGDAWGGVTAVATGLQYDDRRNYDVAWQADGSLCLAVFAYLGDGVRRYATWIGSAWSAVSSGATAGQTTTTFSLYPEDSGAGIYFFLNDTGHDLETLRWNGSGLTANKRLNGMIEGAQKAQPYFVAFPVTAGPQEDRVVRLVEWREVEPD